MSTSTVSSKYQIVIPKELRKKLRIKPGQKVYLSANSKNITIKTTPDVDPYIGVLKSAGDPVDYQRRIRKDKKYS